MYNPLKQGRNPDGTFSSESGAAAVFRSALRSKFGMSVPVTHESPISNLESIQTHGLRASEGLFGAIGHRSNFIIGDKVRVTVKFPPSRLSPDMMYNPDAPYSDLLRRNPKILGAYVSVDTERDIPPSQFTRFEVVRGGKTTVVATRSSHTVPLSIGHR